MLPPVYASWWIHGYHYFLHLGVSLKKKNLLAVLGLC